MTLMSFVCADLRAQEEVVIDEDFSEFTEGSESQPATTDISGYSGSCIRPSDGTVRKYMKPVECLWLLMAET